jgi:glycerol-3-phosphate cytidylyltransferase
MASHLGRTVYTAGVFDMLHMGHINLLEMAAGLGERLIVGVSTDEVVESYKPGHLVVPYEDRVRLVSAVKWVDAVVPQRERNKLEAWRRLKYDVLAVGDDWFGDATFALWERQLAEVGVTTVYLPYTPGVSSTMIRAKFREEAALHSQH